MDTIKVKITRSENATYFKRNINDIVEVNLQEYVAGVVASEVGNASLQAAKAQAVAARTFAYPYYSKGLTITDASSTHQAYRAARTTNGSYPNAVKAAQQTAGQLLTYDGKVIGTCSYSASNGGRTVSSQQRWGGIRAWLIAQDDPWDAAAGTGKTGHGVGMSQRGAKYAASIGKTYEQILAFYYPGTKLTGAQKQEEKTNTEVDTMANTVKASALVAKVREPLANGWGYIWGQHGAVWTAAKQKAATREMTKKYGAKWIGKNVTDCSGLLYWAFQQLGGYMYHGSNTIWNKYCVNKGQLTSGMNIKPGTAVFLNKNGNRHHVGMYVGEDTVIEAQGTQAGVVTSKLSHWDEWGELKGVDYDLAADEFKSAIQKGSKGDAVKDVQNKLIQLGYQLPKFGADGSYGAETIAAVKAFQNDHNITADGICGSATLAAIETAITGKPDETESDPESDTGRTGKVKTGGANLTYRVDASATADKLGSIPNGATVTVLEHVDNWYLIKYNSITGYVMDQYIQIVETVPATYTIMVTGLTEDQAKDLKNKIDVMGYNIKVEEYRS